MSKPRNSILGRKPKMRVSAAYQGAQVSVSADIASLSPATSQADGAACRAQHPGTIRRPHGWRPSPLPLGPGYPEKSPYGLPPDQLLAVIAIEGRLGVVKPIRNKAGHYVWNSDLKRHELERLAA
jgi:hypothetical protein